PEIILFGLGDVATSHLPDIRSALASHQIKMDVMNTPAACRTWNVLLTEGRKAAAALVAIE
ncbi:MAG: Mth938-like domain-containing protein, partial [Candidatus Puniceispirillaceae bacterium]